VVRSVDDVEAADGVYLGLSRLNAVSSKVRQKRGLCVMSWPGTRCSRARAWTKATVQRYRARPVDASLGSSSIRTSSINRRLCAIRTLL
jgi:hypothetical protein